MIMFVGRVCQFFPSYEDNTTGTSRGSAPYVTGQALYLARNPAAAALGVRVVNCLRLIDENTGEMASTKGRAIHLGRQATR